ncbi:DUF7263 family protein [Halostella litorea]|uniref:DUF7263 family protein n=1 Tax=Halostella litorea TaxID=2528831 RepID=UPI001093298F|nr:hypothetical protein [Halostella litorea]
MTRGQANMPALLVALLALSTVAGVGLFVADDAVGSATRDAGERRVAVALSERLVSADGPLAVRGNVLDAGAVASLDDAAFESQYPVARDRAVRVTIDGETLVRTGDADGGTTIRRVVLVERRERVTRTPSLGTNREQSVTLPRRTPNATLTLSPPNGTTVDTVRANDRVVLHNASGITGTATVDLSRFETATLTVESSARLPAGSVSVTYYPSRTRKAVLGVTVDG